MQVILRVFLIASFFNYFYAHANVGPMPKTERIELAKFVRTVFLNPNKISCEDLKNHRTEYFNKMLDSLLKLQLFIEKRKNYDPVKGLDENLYNFKCFSKKDKATKAGKEKFKNLGIYTAFFITGYRAGRLGLDFFKFCKACVKENKCMKEKKCKETVGWCTPAEPVWSLYDDYDGMGIINKQGHEDELKRILYFFMRNSSPTERIKNLLEKYIDSFETGRRDSTEEINSFAKEITKHQNETHKNIKNDLSGFFCGFLYGKKSKSSIKDFVIKELGPEKSKELLDMFCTEKDCGKQFNETEQSQSKILKKGAKRSDVLKEPSKDYKKICTNQEKPFLNLLKDDSLENPFNFLNGGCDGKVDWTPSFLCNLTNYELPISTQISTDFENDKDSFYKKTDYKEIEQRNKGLYYFAEQEEDEDKCSVGSTFNLEEKFPFFLAE